MDNSFDLFFNVITLLCGIYCLYLWFQLQTKGLDAPKCPMVPTDHKASDCLDPNAYVAYIKPRTLILSVVVLLSSICGFLVGNLFEATVWIQSAIIFLPLIVLIWYGFCFIKARKQYW